MIGLVMCGGKGTRMDLEEEKLLIKYKKPVIQHVISALQDSNMFSKIVCITSPNAPKTRQFVKTLGINTIETEGKGYVSDLSKALHRFDETIFVVSGDMALLDDEIVQKIIESVNYKEPWTSVLVRKKFLDSIGTEAEHFIRFNNEEHTYSGISIVNPKKISEMQQVQESYIVLDDKRVAINLNTKKDYDLLCAT
jgi:adenosylcobinamide-phosphate guanylyltransferase